MSSGVCGRIDEPLKHWVREVGREHLPLGAMGKFVETV